MLYALLCYDSEEVVGAWTKEQDDAAMAKLEVVQKELARKGKLGPVARLMPTTAATTLRKGKETIVLDGPFAETKEQLLGLLHRRLRIAGGGHRHRQGAGPGQQQQRLLRDPPAVGVQTGERRVMNDLGWIDLALRSARPRAVGALLRYFRDLDAAEEAFQEACLGALKNWPQNGPPRDPAAWLIFVGPQQPPSTACAARASSRPLPDEEQLSDSATTPRPSWPSAWTAPTTATTSCACCSSAATPSCPPPSRSPSPCASSAGCR